MITSLCFRHFSRGNPSGKPRFGPVPKAKGSAMNKKELKTLATDLIALLQSVRDQIDDTLEELGAVEDADAEEILALSDDNENDCD
jgi:hypothetical protein